MDLRHSVPWFRSLRFKLVAAAITVELVMLSVLLTNSFQLLNKAVASQTEARLEALSPLLDAALAGRVFQRDHVEVRAILNRLTSTQLTEISYITVLDPAGNIIGSAGECDPAALPQEDHSVAEALSDLTYDASLPLTIIGNQVGTVHFGLSLASMMATQDRVVGDGVIIAAAEILLSLLLLVSGGYLITRHIRSLTEGTRRVAQGEYDAQIVIPGQDEIAMLAMDFNAMSAAVATHVSDLRASEMRSQAIFNAVSEAIFIHDAVTGRVLDVNQRMCEMYGCSREEAMALDADSFSSGVHPYTKSEALARVRAAVGGAPQVFEWHARALDGRLFWVEVSLRVARIGDDDRLIAVVRDIGERKKNEEHITRLATAIEQAAEGIIITDGQGIIRYVNPAQKNMTGFGEEELVGSDLSVFSVDGRDDPAEQQMLEALRSGGKWEGRLETRTKTGQVLLQEVIIAPILDLEGRRAGYVTTRRDVTRQVETEKLLAQAQKIEAVGTLAGGIAHDFNNILTAILGYTELAKLHAGTEGTLADNLSHIHAASLRARDLVQQILAFSRKSALQKLPLHISSVVKEALRLMRATIPATIEIRQDISATAAVIADPTQIHQVIMNLCTNAYQAMLESGGVLSVTVRDVTLAPDRQTLPREEVVPGDYVVIEVGDTGCGMDQETMKRVFDPYFTTKETGKGSGLGLAVVHGIVKSHGGRISAYSEPGKGSTFRVLLPVAEVEPVAAECVKKVAAATGYNEQIMFVDDEEEIRNLARDYLTRFGYRVDVFATGADAIARLTESPDSYDLLITDMAMPGMDGKILAQRAMELCPGLPVILCTGYSPLINGEGAKAMGIRYFMQKPVDLAGLLQNMRLALSSGRADN